MFAFILGMCLLSPTGCRNLAQAVITRWKLDGMPSDFDFLDLNNPENGTFYDFWTGFFALWEEKETETSSLSLSELSCISYFY